MLAPHPYQGARQQAQTQAQAQPQPQAPAPQPPAQTAQQPTNNNTPEGIYENIDTPNVFNRVIGSVRRLWGDKEPGTHEQTEMKQLAASSTGQADPGNQAQGSRETSMTELQTLASGKPAQPKPPSELKKVATSAKNAQVAISKSLSRQIGSVTKKIPVYNSLKDFILANPKKTVHNVPFPYLSQEWYNKELPDRGESGPVLLQSRKKSSAIPTLYDEDESDYLEPDTPPTTQAPTPPVSSPATSISSLGSDGGKSGGRAGKAKSSKKSQLPRPNTRSVAREAQTRKNISAKAKTVTDRLAAKSPSKCPRKK